MFTFGVPSIFNFTFRAGSKLPGLADGTIDGESNSSDNRESESSKEVRLIAPLPSHGTESNSPSPCGSLNKVPLEVRNMIYSNVLKFDLDIVRPHRFLGRHPPILAEDSKHIRAIDAALLRTCKAIYHETIRILYHRNRFYFCKPSDIKEFAHAGLGATPFGFYNTINRPSDAVTHAPYGRLTTIRTMRLKLGSEKEGDDLEKVWSFWSEFFYPPEKQEHLDQVVGFPSLERLSLDLRKWKLRISDTNAPQIRVSPIPRIFCRFYQIPVCLNVWSLPLGFGPSRKAYIPAF